MKKIALTAVFAIFASFTLSAAVHALGTSNSITITVKNPPNELYYLDLLVENENMAKAFLTDIKSLTYYSIWYKRYFTEYPFEDDPMAQAMLGYLDRNLCPVLVFREYGTYLDYVYGSLTGKKSGGKMIHSFTGYFNGYKKQPDFRIITVTESGEVKISDWCDSNAYNVRITYDYITGETSAIEEGDFYLFRLSPFTLAAALLAEGLLLFAFGFKIRENLTVFLTVNVFAQVLLLALLTAFEVKLGGLVSAMLYLPFEPFVFAVKSRIYEKKLKGGDKQRRYLYTFTASFAGYALMFLIIVFSKWWGYWGAI